MSIQAYLNLVRWNRPAGWLVLLWPTLSALWLFSGGFPGWHLLVVFVLGTILMRMAGCCVNDVADRHFDIHVQRTKNRPVTTGELSVTQALLCGILCALLAFALVLSTNKATIVGSFFALAITIFYPFTKRFLAIPQAVLGIAFSFGIPLAYTACLGDSWSWHSILTGPGVGAAWLLLLGNLFWVVAYDTEYAMVDRDDDLALGIKTSAITFGRYDVVIIVICYVVFLMTWLVVCSQFLSTPWPYWIGIFFAALQVVWHYTLIVNRSKEGCFKAFTYNHWVGFSIFVGICVSSLFAK